MPFVNLHMFNQINVYTIINVLELYPHYQLHI